MFERLGVVHVVRERRMQPSVYDIAQYRGPDAAQPHVYDAAVAALAAPADRPQTIVCLGPGAVDVADALCGFIARDARLWTVLNAVFAEVCPSGPERVVFTLDAMTNAVLGVFWGAPLPPHDPAAIVSFLDTRVPNRVRQQLGMPRLVEDTTPREYTDFMALLAEINVRDEMQLWRAIRAMALLAGPTPTDAAPLLGLEPASLRRNAPVLAALLHRRVIDWIVERANASTRPAHGAVRMVTVWAEPVAGRPPSFDELCRATVSDVLHAALDASFVAADRDERAADGCNRGTATAGRFSCDFVASRLVGALRDAADADALVAAVGASLTLGHARGAVCYDDVAAWYAADRNVTGAAAQQLLMGSQLRLLMMPSRTAARRGSFLSSPGRDTPSVFGTRLDMAAADINGAVGLHWVCCADTLTVARLRGLQAAADPLHVRIPRDEFVREFHCAVPEVPRTAPAILAAAIGRNNTSRVGSARYVWLTVPAHECLQRIAQDRRGRAAARIQKWWRGARLRRQFVRLRAAVHMLKRRRFRRLVPGQRRELLMLRAIVHHTFSLEYRWDCRFGDGVTAYAGLGAAMAAAFRAPELAVRRVRGMAATGAVVLRLMRYASFARPAYEALRASMTHDVAALEAVALVAAAEPDGDMPLLARLWASGACVVALRIVEREWPVLRAVLVDPMNETACRAGLLAWTRIDDVIGTSIVRAGLVEAVNNEADRRCVAHAAATHGMSTEVALAAAAWLTASGAVLPRWRAALKLCMMDNRQAAAADTAKGLLAAAELRALGVVVAGQDWVVQSRPLRLPVVSPEAVAHAYALDVSFY